MKKYILVLDAGTTSVRALIFDKSFRVVASAFEEIGTYAKSAEIIEQDGGEIFDKSIAVLRQALSDGNISINEISSLAITNQRATSLPWDRDTGIPLRPAINWADCRAVGIIDDIVRSGWMERVRDVMNPPNYMFANIHFAWYVKNDPELRRLLSAGKLCYGTLDSYLIYRLTGGKHYVTTYSNASAYTGFNLRELRWQEDFLDYLGIPAKALPQVVDDAGGLGETLPELLGEPLPIGAVFADQQAGSFAHGAVEEGLFKCTVGTGAFCDLCIGSEFKAAPTGLLPHVTYKLKDKVLFQMEGYVTSAGSAVQWLRDGMGLISDYGEIEPLVESVTDSGGLSFVPALAGLGAPDWESDATGAFIGLSRETRRGHIMRSVLEGIAYRVRDIRDKIVRDCGAEVRVVFVDGGVTKSDYFCQTLADILQVRVERPELSETTSLGAAELAGLTSGFWTEDEICGAGRIRDVFMPLTGPDEADARYALWLRAKERSRRWR